LKKRGRGINDWWARSEKHAPLPTLLWLPTNKHYGCLLRKTAEEGFLKKRGRGINDWWARSEKHAPLPTLLWLPTNKHYGCLLTNYGCQPTNTTAAY